MTSTRVRFAAVASLLLGAGGLTGIGAPAQAAPSPSVGVGQTSTSVSGCLTGTASARSATGNYHRDADADVSAAVADHVERVITSAANRRAATAAEQVTFNVRAHIIVGTRKRDKRRHATKAQVRRQVAWMNSAYAGGEAPGAAADTGVRFRLRSISVTRNNDWFHVRTMRTLNRMKAKLHRGNQRTLNIYLVNLPGGLLGISTFPWQYARHKQLDGVAIAYNSVRGGRLALFNEGDTAVHETGHWLGLLHTFQGGCTPPGDYVDDTPAEGQPSTACTPNDTCSAPGTDPIHNFMDYSYDSCMNQFTSGQTARIQQSVAAYRP